MIDQRRIKGALYVIHYGLVRARMMAFEGRPQNELATLLDGLEILPTLIAKDEDQTATFEEMIKSMAEHTPSCEGAFEAYMDPPESW